ncbi:MAG: AtzE family amidohydrolase [Sphingomonas fennica]
MMPDTAQTIAADVAAGRRTAATVVRAALDRIARADGTINACTAVFADEALAAAAAIDVAVAAGRPVGPLAGVPVAVKNLFDMTGVVTLAGAAMRQGAAPATADATAVARLRAAGAIPLCATNMDEFAYGFTTENAAFGTTRNPRDPARVAGGSSGGSAAAVAAGMAPLALGSDTNGSIRVPASFCGIYGLKPTFGRLSRAGAFPFVASLDHIGPLALTVGDLALAYDVLQGPDGRDPACTRRSPEPVAADLGGGAAGLRVATMGGWFAADAAPEALAAVAAVADALGGRRTVDVPDAAIARYAAFAITAAEGGDLHRPALAARPHAFDPATRDRLMAGALLPAALVQQAQRFRRRFTATMAGLFEGADVLLAPATPCTALRIGQETLSIGGRDMPARAHIGIYTQPLSFVGLPVLTVPVATGTGLPIGVQLVAAPWNEAALFRAAAHLETTGVAAAATF